MKFDEDKSNSLELTEFLDMLMASYINNEEAIEEYKNELENHKSEEYVPPSEQLCKKVQQ